MFASSCSHSAVVAAMLLTGASVLAGPLDPPAGPVAPTQKTLAEVEARIAINAANTPGDANSVYRITESGSYYLTEDLLGDRDIGIEVAAARVTIDLNGFAISGGLGTEHGIHFDGVVDSVTVKNGSVHGWGLTGINLQSLNNVRSVIIEFVHVRDSGVGIRVGANAIIRDCSILDNDLTGIISTGASVIENCAVLDNGDDGISMLVGGVIRECTISGNVAWGIDLNAVGARVIDCAIFGNGNGVRSTVRATISGCNIVENNDDGVRLNGDNNVLVNCTVSNNGTGLRVTSEQNRIEGNTFASNTTGVLVFEPGNFIARNIATDSSGTNWTVAAGNVCFVVQASTSALINGNSGGVSPGSANPFANFSY